jgi:hypothetical protein
MDVFLGNPVGLVCRPQSLPFLTFKLTVRWQLFVSSNMLMLVGEESTSL